jgi:hypothetical protein
VWRGCANGAAKDLLLPGKSTVSPARAGEEGAVRGSLCQIALAAALATSVACSSPYARFYNARTLPAPAVPENGSVRLFQGSDPARDALAMMENGYALVGYSNFNAPAQRTSGAIRQAQKVHASVVLVYGKYTGTVEGTLPFVAQAPPVTSTTNTYGTLVGRGGAATYTDNSTTTTTGQAVVNVPYRIDRYDQVAAYWVKMPPPHFGAIMRDLNDAERAALGRNRGAVVIVTVKNSPAFGADILNGDVITAVDGSQVTDTEDLINRLSQHAGARVVLSIRRGGRSLEIPVSLRADR